MQLFFITGNAHKVTEAKALFPDIEQLDIDLPEIQSDSSRDIIRAKLKEARKRHGGRLIVEDTSLRVDSLHGFPGPLVKWFLKALGAEGLYLAAKRAGGCAVEARSEIGYWDGAKVRFFCGSVRGELVAPRGTSSFGWDPIFQPEGHAETFAEMAPELRTTIKHRAKALAALKRYLTESSVR